MKERTVDQKGYHAMLLTKSRVRDGKKRFSKKMAKRAMRGYNKALCKVDYD